MKNGKAQIAQESNTIRPYCHRPSGTVDMRLLVIVYTVVTAMASIAQSVAYAACQPNQLIITLQLT